jgi:segregation and condensation protein A
LSIRADGAAGRRTEAGSATVAGVATVEPAETPRVGFSVHLDVFEGPFDLLLSLIAKHELDVTLVALSQVTDEFIAHVSASGGQWDLEQTSSFLVVAATLLDLKAARLLPTADLEDDEDVAALEARDLLFARLLQYRAFKQAAAEFAVRIEAAGRSHPRSVTLEEAFVGLLPEVVIRLDRTGFAQLAGTALRPRPAPRVDVSHVYSPQVSVAEQAAIVMVRLRELGSAPFRLLVGDCCSVAEVVGRFLALLDLYRDGRLAFDQAGALAELNIRWVEAGPDRAESTVALADRSDVVPDETMDPAPTPGEPVGKPADERRIG